MVIQPNPASPNTQKTINNAFVLEASLFDELRGPSLSVSVTAPDMVYSGFPYGAVSYNAPSGSVITVEYSYDGGLTYVSTPPTSRGFYYARVTATRDGAVGIGIDSFSILKSTPTITPPVDISKEFATGTETVIFYIAQETPVTITSVTSTNPTAVSVASFTQTTTPTGDICTVVLNRNSIGEAVISASSGETSDYYPFETSFTITLTKLASVISAPATLTLSAANGISYPFNFTTNFNLTPARYSVMEFTSSNEEVATITKNNSYPPTINLLSFGSFEISCSFPGDATYQTADSSTQVTVVGVQPRMVVASSTSGIKFESGEPFGTAWATAKSAEISAGLDANSDGELETEVSLPFTFTISLSQPSSPYVGTTSALSYQFTNLISSQNWITFSQSGDTITGTISSIPQGNGGVISAGSLLLTKAALGVKLAWTATVNLNFFRSGPRIIVSAAGLSGAAGAFTEILTLNLDVNQANEYATSWGTLPACCPHVVQIKGVSAGGAPTNQRVRATVSSGSGVADFGVGIATEIANQDTAMNLNIHKGGTFNLTVGLEDTPAYNKVIQFNVGKLDSSISLTYVTSAAPLKNIHKWCSGADTDDLFYLHFHL
ncbi:MAG: hypothetical protein EBU96_04395 [Actinobacteria bacterium]|nr:hypothetical protein [Actinomycetota bacterium]